MRLATAAWTQIRRNSNLIVPILAWVIVGLVILAFAMASHGDASPD